MWDSWGICVLVHCSFCVLIHGPFCVLIHSNFLRSHSFQLFAFSFIQETLLRRHNTLIRSHYEGIKGEGGGGSPSSGTKLKGGYTPLPPSGTKLQGWGGVPSPPQRNIFRGGAPHSTFYVTDYTLGPPDSELFL